MMRPRHRLLLLFSFLAGFVLRVLYLSRRPIWYDEAFSILLARRPLPDILAGTSADTMPPLYYMMLKAWMAFGSSIAYLRFLNVVLGMGLILLAYHLGRRLFSRETGAWSALLAAGSPFLIYHAQELRMYTLLAVSLTAYALATYQLIHPAEAAEQRRIGRIAFVAVSAAAALYSHNLAAFTLLAPNVFLLIRGNWNRLRDLVLAQLAAGVLFLPWLVIVPGQIAKIQSAFWTPLPGLLQVVQALVTLHTNLPLPQLLIPVALFGTTLTLALTGFGLVKSRGGNSIGFLIILAVAPPTALLVVSYLMRPLFVPRAFIFSLVAYISLIGILIARPPMRGMQVLLLLGFLVPALGSLPSYYQYQSFPRSPFETAGEYLANELGAGERVVHDNKLSYFPIVVYEPELSMVFLGDEPGSHNDTLAAESAEALDLEPLGSIEQAVAGQGGIWFVVFQRAIEEYQAQGFQDHPRVEWLDENYSRQGEVQFGDLRLIHYVDEAR